jgi:hypothetical protein
MLKHSSPMLCDECIVKGHINSLHCIDILCQEESVFRKPACGENITFKLEIERCHSCKMTNLLGNLDETKYVHVFVASQNGIFQCTRPHSENTCSGCGTKLICGPVGFDCLPCEPVDQSGCTWFTTSFISFIRTFRSEGGMSTALSLSIPAAKHWGSNGFMEFSWASCTAPEELNQSLPSASLTASSLRHIPNHLSRKYKNPHQTQTENTKRDSQRQHLHEELRSKQRPWDAFQL